jgi:hypothetical protein
MSESTQANGLVPVLGSVIAGSVVGMVLKKQGSTLEQLIEADMDELRPVVDQIRDLGIDADEVSDNVITTLCHMLLQKDNALQGACVIADILWTALGDPKNNGADPPQKYKEVTYGIYIWFVSLLDPNVMHAFQIATQESSSNG